MLDIPSKKARIKKKKGDQARSNRGKGKRGERLACTELSKWYGVPESFIPSKASGASFRRREAGDIATPPKFPFIIEVKNQEVWKMQDFLEVKKPRMIKGEMKTALSPFKSYWNQVTHDVKHYNENKHATQIEKYPMLIFTKNFETLIMMIDKPLILAKLLPQPPSNDTMYLVWEAFDDKTFYIISLIEFINNNPLNTQQKGIIYD